MAYCIVKTCKNYARKVRKDDGVSYFSFPRDPIRCALWKSIIASSRREEYFDPKECHRICSDHFIETDMYTTCKGLRRLKKTAVPKLLIGRTVTDSLEPKSKCTCCLQDVSSNQLRGLWQPQDVDGETKVYGDMLIDCFELKWIRPEDPDASTEQICDDCLKRLMEAFSFKADVIASRHLFNMTVDSVKSVEVKVERIDETKSECDDYELLLEGNDADDSADNKDTNDSCIDDNDFNEDDKRDELDPLAVILKEEPMLSPEHRVECTSDAETIPSHDTIRCEDSVQEMNTDSKIKVLKVTIDGESDGSEVNQAPVYRQMRREGLHLDTLTENLRRAVDAIQKNSLSENRAAKRFNVPRELITKRLQMLARLAKKNDT